MRRIVLFSAIIVAFIACGDDEEQTVATATSSSSSVTTGAAGGSGGASTTTAGGGGTNNVGGGAADGGGGGTPYVDPIAGILPVEALSSGHAFTEGPLWINATLRFSDIPDNEIWELTPPMSTAIWRSNSGGANGLGIDAQGRQVTCEGGNRRVTRTAQTADIEVLADMWMGDRLNRPNDNIVHSGGSIYFTDPDYGLNANDKDLAFQGVFRIAPDGQMSLIEDTLSKPNGIALSPAEDLLYVTDAARDELWKFDVASDGTVSVGAKWLDTAGTPDGMAVNDQGDLFVTTAAGIQVFDASGAELGIIAVPEQPANCTFGGGDRRDLYITARTGVYSVKLNVPGLP